MLNDPWNILFLRYYFNQEEGHVLTCLFPEDTYSTWFFLQRNCGFNSAKMNGKVITIPLKVRFNLEKIFKIFSGLTKSGQDYSRCTLCVLSFDSHIFASSAQKIEDFAKKTGFKMQNAVTSNESHYFGYDILFPSSGSDLLLAASRAHEVQLYKKRLPSPDPEDYDEDELTFDLSDEAGELSSDFSSSDEEEKSVVKKRKIVSQ